MSQNSIKDIYTLRRQFLEYLEVEKGRSIKTIENYDPYLSRFITHLDAKRPGDITEESVRQFRLWLNRQKGISRENLRKNTQNYYVIAIRTFLKYLHNILPPAVAREILAPDRIELAKTGQRDLDLISSDELQRLLSAPGGSTAGEKVGENTLRDRSILELLFSTGLRVSELCNLN